MDEGRNHVAQGVRVSRGGFAVAALTIGALPAGASTPQVHVSFAQANVTVTATAQRQVIQIPLTVSGSSTSAIPLRWVSTAEVGVASPRSGSITIPRRATGVAIRITIPAVTQPGPATVFVVSFGAHQANSVSVDGSSTSVLVRNPVVGPPPAHNITVAATACIGCTARIRDVVGAGRRISGCRLHGQCF
jgi:hypothetical protein